MDDSRQSEIKRASRQIAETLEAQHGVPGTELAALSKAKRRKLPRKVRRSVEQVAEIEKRLPYQPYVLDSQRNMVRRAEQKIAKAQSDETGAKSRKVALKSWLSSLAVNYLIFIGLLAAFWYVSTQL